MYKKYFFLLTTNFFLLLINNNSAFAYSAEGIWYGLFDHKELNESLRVHQEFQVRTNTETGSTQQTLFRAGPLWQWTENQEVGIIYGLIHTGNIVEHRITQQHTYKFSPILSLRSRLEERALEKNSGIDIRTRFNLRYQKNAFGSQYFVAWNELFLNISRANWVYNHIFDRNRAFIGWKSQFDKVSLEYGYLNQYTNRSGSDLNEHIFLIYISI